MGYTKRELILAAFEEIGLASYTYDLQADQIASAGNRLDAMMAEWDKRGIHLGYPITGPGTIDIDAQTGVPSWANQAVVTNLAIRVAPTYGRTVMPETRFAAKTAYNTVLAAMTSPPTQSMPDTMPAGAGNKPWLTTQNPFLDQSLDDDTILVGSEGDLTFE